MKDQGGEAGKLSNPGLRLKGPFFRYKGERTNSTLIKNRNTSSAPSVELR
jgi:hypothetical protein